MQEDPNSADRLERLVTVVENTVLRLVESVEVTRQLIEVVNKLVAIQKERDGIANQSQGSALKH